MATAGPDPTEVWTIVVAAGSGSRFGADKLAVALDGDNTVLDVSLHRAVAASDGVVLVVRADDPILYASPIDPLRLVAGGATRSDSVRRGLDAIPESAAYVLVHDAARPGADNALYQRVIGALQQGATAVVPAVPVVDTIRSVDGSQVDQDQLRAVQTPQGFAADALRAAHASGSEAPDDATLVEATGAQVVLVDGDVRNLKVTHPGDVEVLRSLLYPRSL